MSQILSTLISSELSVLGGTDPASQKLFADAIARAIQEYLNTQVFTISAPPTKLIAK